MSPRPAPVLRVALLHQGAVTERLIRPGQPVSVGSDPGCTLPLPLGAGPARQLLFTPRRRGGHHLLLAADGLGRVRTTDDGTMNLAMLALRRQARAHGDAHRVPLLLGDRGKVGVGDAVVLFQYVPAPPEALQTLDRDFRPRLLDPDDPAFLGILGVVAAAAAVLMVFVYQTEPVELVTAEEVVARVASFTIPLPATPDEPPPPALRDPPPPPEGVAVQRAAPPEPPALDAHGPDPVARAARIEARRDDVRQSALFRAIADDPAGLFDDDDAGYEAVAAHLADLDVTPEAHGAGPVLRRRTTRDGDGDRGVGGVGTSSGGTEVGVGPVAAAAPGGTARIAAIGLPSLDPSDPDDASLIREVVRSGVLRVQSCYTRRLKEDPTLEGRLVLQFDITLGKTLGVQVTENGTGDAALEECAVRQVRGWRFDRTVTATRVEVPMVLVPTG